MFSTFRKPRSGPYTSKQALEFFYLSFPVPQADSESMTPVVMSYPISFRLELAVKLIGFSVEPWEETASQSPN